MSGFVLDVVDGGCVTYHLRQKGFTDGCTPT